MNHKSSLMFVAITAALLSGCGRDVDTKYGDAPALDQWTQQIEKQARPKLDPMPAPVRFDPVAYNASGFRDPFIPAVEADDSTQIGRPDSHRTKQMLERFALDSLKMVGTIGSGAKMVALVKAPDNLIYRVGVGQYLGMNDGLVVSVDEGHVVLNETVRDGMGGWEQRRAGLTLEGLGE